MSYSVLGHLISLATGLFIQQFVQAYKEENMKPRHYWPFVRGIHQPPTDPPHKGPAMWKCFYIIASCFEYLQGPILVSWVPAGALTPNSARSSAGTVLTGGFPT